MQPPDGYEAEQYQSFALVRLRDQWGQIYGIRWDGVYLATRLDNGDVISAFTEEELIVVMIIDSAANPPDHGPGA